MASSTASGSADVKREKLSFAKIAAAGIRAQNSARHTGTGSSTDREHQTAASPHEGATDVASDGVALPQSVLKPKKLMQLASRDYKDVSVTSAPGAQARVQIAERPRQSDQISASFTSSTQADDASSSDSNKPPSMDGKSVASGTTFNALDEKESLRPDDSASVKAVDDEELYSAPGSGMPSRIGSDDGVRAFRDQLREISAMEPARRGVPAPAYGAGTRGVLYVPPQGPGIGLIPGNARNGPITNPTLECPPDPKLLEALENPRDRVWVLKLEQDVIDFVKDATETSLTLPQCHSFYRLLAHKMADYYMLGHLIEDNSAAVRLYKTQNHRIPPPLTGITAPSTAASTPPPSAPAMKILRRGEKHGPATANGSGLPSKNGSENGDSGDEKKKGPQTREEREARYEAARLRIMGSAKPTESPETPKEKQDSRSSSAAGKKSRRKARADDDDGFEARSAYSNYYTTSFSSEGVSTPSYAFPAVNEQSVSQFQAIYGQQSQTSPFGQLPGPPAGPPQWSQPAYQNLDPTQAWAQGQSGAFDLSSDFQQMSLQNQPVPQPNHNMTYGQAYGAPYRQQYYSPQQSWQQQQYQMPSQSAQQSYPRNAGFTAQAGSANGQYQFGQLPSQAFPGRPANHNEHPLPGSYKGKNFNPQSQTFVPGQVNDSPVIPHGVPSTPGNFRPQFQAQSPGQLVRHTSTQSQASSFGSPIQQQQQSIPHLPSNAALKHPLPHGPVFPRQSSPHVPLPAKPGAGQSYTMAAAPQASPQMIQTQSLLAKWGTPSSLPAKPPPSREPYDGSKISQLQRQPFNNPGAARQSSAFPPYPMPPGHLVSGAGPYKG